MVGRLLPEVRGRSSVLPCRALTCMDSADKDDAGVLTRETVCDGLLRLPRVMLLVEKVRSLAVTLSDTHTDYKVLQNVSVLLNCAGWVAPPPPPVSPAHDSRATASLSSLSSLEHSSPLRSLS